MTIKKSALALLGLIAFFVPTATRADDIDNVMISLTYNGNDSCGVTGTALCSQTLSESFQWDNTTDSSVPGTWVFSSSGALGTSFSPSPATPTPLPALLSGSGPFIIAVIQNSASDGMTIAVGDTPPPLLIGTYSFSPFNTAIGGTFSGDLFCNSSACRAEFIPIGLPMAVNGIEATSGTATVSAVPEPSSLLLLGSGLLGGIGAMRRRFPK